MFVEPTSQCQVGPMQKAHTSSAAGHEDASISHQGSSYTMT